MTAAPTGAVELLERALAYTRGALLHVTPADLRRPTPCSGWDLDQLLVHMDDALDAFTEGASGTVALEPGATVETRVSTLQDKACGLLGAWSGPDAPSHVRLGDLAVETGVVVLAAALEITVHGWDVAQATGRATPVPEALAQALLPVAVALVDDADRGTLFSQPVVVADGASDAVRLMAYLGRGRPTLADAS